MCCSLFQGTEQQRVKITCTPKLHILQQNTPNKIPLRMVLLSQTIYFKNVWSEASENAPSCYNLIIFDNILGLNRSSGNSGWLNVTFWDLKRDSVKKQQAAFYDKISKAHRRNTSISLAGMYLSLDWGGNIQVRQQI